MMTNEEYEKYHQLIHKAIGKCIKLGWFPTYQWDHNDLAQEIWLFIIKRWDSFDENKSSRATWIFNWAIFALRGCRKQGNGLIKIPVDAHKNAKRKAQVFVLNKIEQTKNLFSLNQNLKESWKSQTFIDVHIKEPLDNIIAEEDKIIAKKQVEDLISILNEREREIIILRNGLYGHEEKTLAEIAESWNLTRERIRQIEARAWEKMKKKVHLLSISQDSSNYRRSEINITNEIHNTDTSSVLKSFGEV